MHNLDIECLAGFICDPRSGLWWEKIAIKEVNLNSITKMLIHSEIDAISEDFDRITLQQECPFFKCSLCDAGYTSKGFLQSHMAEKHGQEKLSFICNECGKKLSSARNLENHIINIHRTCKQCKPNATFSTKDELEHHKMITLCVKYVVRIRT